MYLMLCDKWIKPILYIPTGLARFGVTLLTAKPVCFIFVKIHFSP